MRPEAYAQKQVACVTSFACTLNALNTLENSHKTRYKCQVMTTNFPIRPPSRLLNPALLHHSSHRPPRSRSASVTALFESAEVATACLVSLAVAAELRPRGWCKTQLVEVQILAKSTDPDAVWTFAQEETRMHLQAGPSAIHNLGVFAKEDISRGTVIGAYPGFKRSRQDMDAKVREWPAAKGYVFASDAGWFLDPTDFQGQASVTKLWWFADTTLAFVNEPQKGQDTNICMADGSDELDILFVASRDIQMKEELLVDYGKFYDRSQYKA